MRYGSFVLTAMLLGAWLPAASAAETGTDLKDSEVVVRRLTGSAVVYLTPGPDSTTQEMTHEVAPVVGLQMDWSIRIAIGSNATHYGTSETRTWIFTEGPQYVPCNRLRVGSFTAWAAINLFFFWPDVPPTPQLRDRENSLSGNACSQIVVRATQQTYAATTVAHWGSTHDAVASGIEWQDSHGTWRPLVGVLEMHGACRAESHAFTGHIQGQCYIEPEPAPPPP